MRGGEGVCFPPCHTDQTQGQSMCVHPLGGTQPASANQPEDALKPFYFGVDIRSEVERKLGLFPKALLLNAACVVPTAASIVQDSETTERLTTQFLDTLQVTFKKTTHLYNCVDDY